MDANTKNKEEIEEEEFLGQLVPKLYKLYLLIKMNLMIKLQLIKKNIKELLENAQVTTTQTEEINHLRQENNVLKHKCNQLEKEQQMMKEQLDKIENVRLENNLILQ